VPILSNLLTGTALGPHASWLRADRNKPWLLSSMPEAMGNGEVTMYLVLFLVLLIAWILGLLAFHIAGAVINLLLVCAVISLVVHFARGIGAKV
jgi:uncharacterized membrane protein